MELKILIKNTSYLVFAKIIKFLTGVVRSKIIAVYLGTLGSGVISQLTQLTQALSQFTLLGMNDGLVKLIAEQNKETEEYRDRIISLLKSYLLVIITTLSVALTLGIIFSDEITKYLLGDLKYKTYYYIGLVSFPILVINSFSFALLKSYKLMKYIARSEMLVVFLNLLIFIPLVVIWGLTGGVISVVFAFLTVLIINQYYAQKFILNKLSISYRQIIFSSIDIPSIKELLLFAGFGLTAGIALIATETITRGIVVSNLGIRQIGVYSPVTTWGSLFTGFILPSISTYLYPRLSEAKSNREVSGILNDSFRLVTLMMIPFLLLSIPIRYKIIELFYSKEFLAAGDYLPWHFIGLLFYLWMYVFTQAMTPTGRIKLYGVLVIVMCIIDVCVVYFLVPKLGMYAWMLKFIISPTIFFLFYFLYFKTRIEFKIKKENVVIMIYVVLSFFILMLSEIYLMYNYVVNFIIGSLLTGFSVFILKKSEKDYLLHKIKW